MKKVSQVCFVCDSDEVNDVELGEFKKSGKISAHYFCLLLASGLVQKGDDDQGILGFMPKDIKAEVERIKKLKCFYCKKIKANIGCCDKKCRRTFHTSCGITNDCLMQFEDPYPAYCNLHVDQGLANAETGLSAKRKKHTAKDMCTICYETMGQFHPITSVLSPCCKAHWFHKRCLMEFAKTSGYFFKCPMCNNVDQFREAVKMRGVFVPDTDAAWETEPNAFAELLERPDTCEATTCHCPDGRDHEDTQYQMIRCDTCGSHSVHNKCMLTKEPFTCVECVLPSAAADAVPSNASVSPSIGDCVLSQSPDLPDTTDDDEIDVECDDQINADKEGDSEDDANISDMLEPICQISSTLSANSEKSSSNLQTITAEASVLDPDTQSNELKSPDIDTSLVDGKNTSVASDVEFVETKEEVLCISDDDSENASTSKVNLNLSVSKKRALDEMQSPPINPPSKKIRRALATMRNQSKITSFFNIIGLSGGKPSNDAAGAHSYLNWNQQSQNKACVGPILTRNYPSKNESTLTKAKFDQDGVDLNTDQKGIRNSFKCILM